jgi:hypothetical protein
LIEEQYDIYVLAHCESNAVKNLQQTHLASGGHVLGSKKHLRGVNKKTTLARRRCVSTAVRTHTYWARKVSYAPTCQRNNNETVKSKRMYDHTICMFISSLALPVIFGTEAYMFNAKHDEINA